MSEDARATFNLISEPWIAVTLTDGASTEVSLQDVFRRAHEIRRLGGELPTQSFAITRLLLAILYRLDDEQPLDIPTWRSWHEDGLPLDDIDDYLDEFADRFDLLHPTRPFFQVADLSTASGERKSVAPLILDLPSNNRLFTNRAGSGAADLSLAEAARWLVNAQAFDASGIKSGAIGDERVKGGKGYPIGVAWSGLLGGVLAQGATLRETLLLNLVADSHVEFDLRADLPPWEDGVPDTAAERVDLLPHGPVRLYTWQSRRIRLFADGDRVTGCLVANGDKLTPQNLNRFEPMTAWRFSEPQTKQAKRVTYMPREHLPGRALWRGIGALLPGISATVPKHDVPSTLQPGIVDWIAELTDRGHLPASTLLRLRAVGVVYGSNNSVVDEVLDDEVLMSVALLRMQNRVLTAQAERAVQLANDGVSALRRLAENLERAAGGSGESAKDRAIDSAYAAFDAPYRAWLATLGDETDPLDAIDSWKATARRILRELGAELVADAGPAAWVGREVSHLGATELITTPRAESWFLRSLTKIFGPPPQAEAEPEEEDAA